MPLHDTHAFVLRTFTLKEADKICVFLTKDAGMVRGVAKGARRLRSKFGASLEPFTEVRISYFQNENKELVSLADCDILRSPFVAGISAERLGGLHYLAELLLEFVPEHEPNELVYRLVSATLPALKDATDEQLVGLLRYFEIWLLKLSGFLADSRWCGECERAFTAAETIWLNNEGTPRCYQCCGGAGDELLPTVRLTLSEMLTQGPAQFLQTPREPFTLTTLGGIATRLIGRVLERDLKSFELLGRLKPDVSCS